MVEVKHKHKIAPPADCPRNKQKRVESNGDDRDKFLAYFRSSGLPLPASWPDGSPVFVSASQRAPNVTYDLPGSKLDGSQKSFPLDGEVIHFDGPLFRGKIVSRMRDVPHSLNDSTMEGRVNSQEYFEGRSRQYQWSVQGMFSKRMRFDEVVTGQDFGRPFRNAPATALVKRGLALLKNRLPSTFECDLFADEPRFEHPLIAGCQHFRVDEEETVEGVGPDTVFGEDDRGGVVEDTRLLADSAIPQDPDARRKFFSKAENLECFFYEPGLVYTFDFYANFFSPARHKLEITPFFSVDLIPYFNGYPIFMAMAKEKSTGEYLWATELWHERLLDYDSKPGGLTRLLSFGPRRSHQETTDEE